MICVKTLKKKKSGLIINETFGSAPMNPRLRPNATYSYGSSGITIESGEIIFDFLGAENCVIEIENDYIAQAQGDFGGFRLQSGASKMDFVEHYKQSPGTFQGVRLIKLGSTFVGKGSNDLSLWIDRGSVSLNGVEFLSVIVIGSTPYVLKNFKAYESEYVNIYGTLDGWELYVDDEFVAVSDKGELRLHRENYPFTGNFKIYDGDTLLCDCDLSDVWGGDDYECAVDVDILNEFREALPILGEEFLGKLDNGYILRTMYLRNNTDEETPVTLRVAEYSPFFDWAWLSFNEVDISTYEDHYKELETVLPAHGEKTFNLYIKRPDNAVKYDYENKTSTFFLELI